MKLALVVFSAGLVACAFSPAPPPAPLRQTNLALSISQATLANGLRVVLVRDPRATDVQVTMRYRVGAVDDPAGQDGVAHLVEHLMFQQVLGAQTVFAKLQRTATFFNAVTTRDATTYITRLPPDELDAVLAVEAVRVGFRCATINASAYEREREVVKNELRLDGDDVELLAAIEHAVYPAAHPYARRPFGTDATLSTITRDQACGFADAHYTPSNAVMVIAGNLDEGRVAASLGKFMARVAKRVPSAAAVEVPLVTTPQHTAASAPVETTTLAVAWPLPADPKLRAQMRLVAAQVAQAIDVRVAGRVIPRELGDERAPMLAVMVELEDDDTVIAVTGQIEEALQHASDAFRPPSERAEDRFERWLFDLSFSALKSRATYRLFSQFEQATAMATGRDTRLAAHTLAGGDPRQLVDAELAAVRELTPETAASVAQLFTFASASVITLNPTTGPREKLAAVPAPQVHDVGQHRDADPGEAQRPATGELETAASPAVTRTLANGMHVVLLPLTSVPTVDVRMVFGTGAGEEPADKRGVALLAAYGLDWNLIYLDDVANFAAAGGTIAPEIDGDHTTFVAQGLDMHLDYLLSGMRRLVREGRYAKTARRAATVLRETSKETDDEGELTDLWRDGVYGKGHPYAHASMARHVSASLTVDDARQFRARHYTPANATLIIAGHFDAALADKWIDFLFADWAAPAATAVPMTRATVQPISLARDEDSGQIAFTVALPSLAGTRPSQLVAAEMLGNVVSDVRHQLGASYSLGADLEEQRASRRYVFGGSVEASRAAEAFALIKTQLASLRADPDAAARAFVIARAQAVAKLRAAAGSARSLAIAVEGDVVLGRAPLSDRATALAVQQLRIGAMTPVLVDLDLDRAALRLQGPAKEVDATFAALGRTATRVAARAADPETPFTQALADERDEDLAVDDFEDALTRQRPAGWLAGGLTLGYVTGKALGHGVSGFSVSGELGVRASGGVVGLRLSMGRLDGKYNIATPFLPVYEEVDVLATSATAFVRAEKFDRLWGGAFLGVGYDRGTTGMDPSVWNAAVVLGLDGGVDVVRYRGNRLTVFARLEAEVASDVSIAALSFGLGYRR